MSTFIVLLSCLRSTSNLALSCADLHRLVKSNGFPIKTSKGCLCPDNFSFYKSLSYPKLDEWTINAFRHIIKTNDCDQLLLLLQKGANIEAKDSDGTTVLMLATYNGQLECLRILLEQGADTEAWDVQDGNTALIDAAVMGKSGCLKLLLEYKADIEAEDGDGDTALNCIATLDDKIDCLRILLENKANIETKDGYRRTPLKQAAENGRTDNLKVLLEHGARVSPGLRERYPQYAELWPDSTL